MDRELDPAWLLSEAKLVTDMRELTVVTEDALDSSSVLRRVNMEPENISKFLYTKGERGSTYHQQWTQTCQWTDD